MEPPILSLQHVCKTFYHQDQEFFILKDVQFVLQKGEMVALTGASGAGKTTLLQIMGLIDEPTRGTITVGESIFASTQKKSAYRSKLRDETRKNSLGFVYQYHYLLPELTALENVVLPQLILGMSKAEAQHVALLLLQEMGLANRASHTLHQLSGGEQQRVAIARALANEPQIVLADEPTGNLDDKTALLILDMMLTRVRERGISMVIATHNMELAARMDKKVHLHQGQLISG